MKIKVCAYDNCDARLRVRMQVTMPLNDWVQVQVAVEGRRVVVRRGVGIKVKKYAEHQRVVAQVSGSLPRFKQLEVDAAYDDATLSFELPLELV